MWVDNSHPADDVANMAPILGQLHQYIHPQRQRGQGGYFEHSHQIWVIVAQSSPKRHIELLTVLLSPDGISIKMKL
jgi:hypothetical protein